MYLWSILCERKHLLISVCDIAADEPAYIQKMQDVRLADRPQRGNSHVNASDQVSSVPEQSSHNIKNKTLDMTKKQLDELPLDSLETAGFNVAHLKLGIALLHTYFQFYIVILIGLTFRS